MKISIVTPTFNSGKYITDTLDTIHNQDFKNLEHLVCDGASSDDTLEILRKYERDLVWLSEKDSGQSDAINKGLRRVTGDIIAWQNADDLYEADTFSFVVDFFKKNKDVGLLYGAYHEIDEEGNWICSVNTKPWDYKKFKRGRFCPVQPTVFWRKEVQDRVGLLNENLHYCMDVDFYSRIIKAGFKAYGTPKILGSFRVHQESKTQNASNRKKHKEEYLKVLSKNFQYSIFDRLWFEAYYQRAQLAVKVKRIFKL